MVVTVKETTNLDDIQYAKQHNMNMNAQYAGQGYIPSNAFMDVPKPIYEEQEWNFKLHNLLDYHVESQDPRDIIANVLYKGLVRIKYEPAVEAKFETFMSLSL